MQPNIKEFQDIIWEYYRTHGRKFPWRLTHNPYHILVSEIMLQQTQTHRVVQKYEQFIALFSSFEALAQAPLHNVICAWQGLGYNRRAIALHNNAKRIIQEFDGNLPHSPATLLTFSSIGPNTAGSICAFAFNQPTIFIETNIRAVFIHFFFQHANKVHDKELLPLVAQAVDVQNPREWYYALMDYGVMVKKECKNPARKSTHHAQQSTFQGSHRQIRGMILKLFSQHQYILHEHFLSFIDRDSDRIELALSELCKEGFLMYKNGGYKIRL